MGCITAGTVRMGIDIFDKSALQERRIKTLEGSQVDEGFLRETITLYWMD
jgi:hypothetical protein